MRKKGFMPIRVGKAFYAQINRCAGAGPVAVRNQSERIDKSGALAIRVADGHKGRPCKA